MKRLEGPALRHQLALKQHTREAQFKKINKFFTVSRIKPLCIIILFLECIKQATE